MLRKLMKHEFRATGRVMLPLYLILLVTAVGARMSINGLMDTDVDVLNVLGTLLVVAFAVAMAAVCLVSVFLMVQRFYQNLLRDEGYVMMTLPVSIHQQVWSKLLVGVVWCVATILVVCAALFILAFELDLVEAAFQELGDVFKFLRAEFGVDGVLGIVEVLVLGFCALCSMYLEFYSALSIGHSFANHKLIWSVAAYFGTDFVISIVTGLLATIAHGAGVPEELPSMSYAVHAGLLVSAAACALSAALYYAITTWVLKHKLNLE